MDTSHLRKLEGIDHCVGRTLTEHEIMEDAWLDRIAGDDEMMEDDFTQQNQESRTYFHGLSEMVKDLAEVKAMQLDLKAQVANILSGQRDMQNRQKETMDKLDNLLLLVRQSVGARSDREDSLPDSILGPYQGDDAATNSETRAKSHAEHDDDDDVPNVNFRRPSQRRRNN